MAASLVGPGAVASAIADGLIIQLPLQLAALAASDGPVGLSPGATANVNGARLYIDANADAVQPRERPAVRVYATRLILHQRSEPEVGGQFVYRVRYGVSVFVSVAGNERAPGLVEARNRLVLATRWALMAQVLNGLHRTRPDTLREAYWPPGPGEAGAIVADARIDIEVDAIEGPSLAPVGVAAKIEVVTTPMTKV